MRTRRTLLGAAALAGIGAMAGCIDLEDLLGEGLDADAEPGGIPDDAVSAAGFQHIETREFSIDEEFSIGDETVELSATNWAAAYAPEVIDDDDFDEDADPDEFDHLNASDVAGAIVVSTPSAEFAGQEVNPVEHFSIAELIQQFDDGFVNGSVDSIEEVGTREAVILGDAVELSVFEAEVQPDDTDETLRINLYVTVIESGDDYVLPIGLHHRSLDATETVVSLLEATEHPVEEP